jgi:hypothetical protein
MSELTNRRQVLKLLGAVGIVGVGAATGSVAAEEPPAPLTVNANNLTGYWASVDKAANGGR